MLQTYGGKQLKKRRCFPSLNLGQSWKNLKKQVKVGIQHIKRQLMPWENQIKQVESHFGSIVASYFIFLRWLVGMNLVIFFIMTTFVVMPEIFQRCAGKKKLIEVPPEVDKTSIYDLRLVHDFGGIVRYSPFYYGYYTSFVSNQTSEDYSNKQYNLPLAYFLSTLIVLLYSFAVILHAIAGSADATENLLDDDDLRFSIQVFSCWDFKVANQETADIKIASIATSIREAILEEEESGKKQEQKTWSTRILRVIANILVGFFLLGSGYIIYDIVLVSKYKSLCLESKNEIVDWFTSNQVSVTMSIIGLFFPDILGLIGKMERFHPRIALRWLLGRVFILYFLNLATLMYALFERIGDEENQDAETFTDPCDSEKTTVIMVKLARRLRTYLFPNSTDHLLYRREAVNTSDIFANQTKFQDECWETGVGQELAKLIVFDMYTVILSILVFDFFRGLLVRYINPIWPFWDLEDTYPQYAEFQLADNILHLIYNQGVLWMACYFSPVFPLIHLMKIISIFYLRAWSVLATNLPSRKIFRASKSNSFYLVLLLFMLLVIMLPIVYSMSIKASKRCGPYSTIPEVEKSYEILKWTIKSINIGFIAKTFAMLSSPTVIVPCILVMIMMIYYLKTTNEGKSFALIELKNNLVSEREDFKKRMAQRAAKDDALSGRKSQLQVRFST